VKPAFIGTKCLPGMARLPGRTPRVLLVLSAGGETRQSMVTRDRAGNWDLVRRWKGGCTGGHNERCRHKATGHVAPPFVVGGSFPPGLTGY
jgi:hypothetical protein